MIGEPFRNGSDPTDGYDPNFTQWDSVDVNRDLRVNSQYLRGSTSELNEEIIEIAVGHWM